MWSYLQTNRDVSFRASEFRLERVMELRQIRFFAQMRLLQSTIYVDIVDVVATTCQNGTCSLLTSAKLSVGYLVVEIIKELNKKLSLYCSSIYINYMWSVLQQYLSVLISMYRSHILLLIHHKTTMPYTCALMSYFLISTVHIYTMYTP